MEALSGRWPARASCAGWYGLKPRAATRRQTPAVSTWRTTPWISPVPSPCPKPHLNRKMLPRQSLPATRAIIRRVRGLDRRRFGLAPLRTMMGRSTRRHPAPRAPLRDPRHLRCGVVILSATVNLLSVHPERSEGSLCFPMWRQGGKLSAAECASRLPGNSTSGIFRCAQDDGASREQDNGVRGDMAPGVLRGLRCSRAYGMLAF